METANVRRRCHRCPDVGAFLEIYLTKYYSTEGKSVMPVFPPRGHFTSAHFHASDVFRKEKKHWTTKWVIFRGILGIVSASATDLFGSTEKDCLIGATWQLAPVYPCLGPSDHVGLIDRAVSWIIRAAVTSSAPVLSDTAVERVGWSSVRGGNV